MQFIRMIASKVTVFNQGAILVEDDVEAILRNPTVRDVYLGKKIGRMMLEVSRARRRLRAHSDPERRELHRRRGRIRRCARPQRHGQDDPSASTLMGFLPATAGRVTFAGEDVTRAEPYRRARLGMGYVPQGREIFPGLSVLDNLRMGCGRTEGRRSRDAIEAVLEEFPRLNRLTDRPGGGALRRRAATARDRAVPRAAGRG